MGYKANEYKISKRNPRDKLREDADLDFGIYVGEVIVRPKDQSHSGRIPVYIPMLSKDRNDPKGYYNAYWSSPFAGTSPSAAVGDNEYRYQDTMKTYGMWMVPPDPGNFVLVIFGDGKKKNPIIIGCLFPDQMQNMVPGNPAGVTYGTKTPLPVAEKNRKSGESSHGPEVPRPINPYIAYPIVKQGLINDPVRGTTTSGARRESPSQVFGILTPGPEDVNFDTGKLDGTHRKGGHSFVLDDHEAQRHIRLRTAGGAQLLLDDTNEIVYVINSPGTAWVELAKDGSIHLFSDENINMRSTSNINIRADHTLNLDGGVRVNINAGLLDELGGDVDTLKLGAPSGGDVFIQAGDTINSLVNGMIKMEAREGSIQAAAKNQVNLYGESAITSKSAGTVVSESAGDTFVTSGGSTNIVSGGQSFVKGSTVHLNDGGSTNSGINPEPIRPIPVNVFKDEPMSIPVWQYDHNSDVPLNPLPTEGRRKSDPGELPVGVSDPDDNYKDPRGTKIQVASITTMITTREPWFGHLTKDTTLPTRKSWEQSYNEQDIAEIPGTSTWYTGMWNGPDNIVEPDGTFVMGTGYDGVKGSQLPQYIEDIIFDPATGTGDTNLAQNVTPDYEIKPQFKSKTFAGGELTAEFDNKVADALTDGYAKSQFHEATETDLGNAGYWYGQTGGNAPTLIGYKHIIGDKEAESRTIIAGGGKLFDPTSETVILKPQGKPRLSVKGASDIVKNALPGQDLSDYGIKKAHQVNSDFSSTDNTYVLSDPTYGDIYMNSIDQGMSKQASKQLLRNDITQHSADIANFVNRPMSMGQHTGLVMLHHMIGPGPFREHKGVNMFRTNSNPKTVTARLGYASPEDSYFWSGKDRIIMKLFQTPDRYMPYLINYMQNEMPDSTDPSGWMWGWDELEYELWQLQAHITGTRRYSKFNNI